MGDIQFEILISDEVISTLSSSFNAIGNEKILSLINDFEDGRWRYNKFQNFIWDNIAETALSSMEREKLVDKSHTKLVQAAKNLRLTDKEDEKGKGSELAEIFLYGIMKHFYKALPVVPKIFYKQNSQDNAKGADSVHIVIGDNNDFSIWFGEAKFYKDLNKAMDVAISSIMESLDTEKLKKENRIITGIRDIDELLKDKEELKANIKSFLDNNKSIDYFKPKLHIPILLLHECTKTKNCTELTDVYKNDIRVHHIKKAEEYYTKQVQKLNRISQYSEITFHLILFPVPNKQEIINGFVKNVKFYKEQ